MSIQPTPPTRTLAISMAHHSLGLQRAVGHHKQLMRTLQLQLSLLMHRELIQEAQIEPDATVAPERVLELERPDVLSETISIGDESCPAPHPNQGTGQLSQTQEIDGVLRIVD